MTKTPKTAAELPSDLANLIAGVAYDPDADRPLANLAAWLDEHYPATRATYDPVLPPNFRRFWLAHGAKDRLAGLVDPLWRGHPTYRVTDALDRVAVAGVAQPSGGWFDHLGWTAIAGIPVLVGEPYQTLDAGLVAARQLARDFACVVSASDTPAPALGVAAGFGRQSPRRPAANPAS